MKKKKYIYILYKIIQRVNSRAEKNEESGTCSFLPVKRRKKTFQRRLDYNATGHARA